MKTKTIKIAIATTLLSSTVAFAAVKSNPYGYNPDIDYRSIESGPRQVKTDKGFSLEELDKIKLSDLKTEEDKKRYYIGDIERWYQADGKTDFSESRKGLEALSDKGDLAATYALAQYYSLSMKFTCDGNWKCVKAHGIDPDAEKYYKRAADMDITGESYGRLVRYYSSIRTKEAKALAMEESTNFVAMQKAYRENLKRQIQGY
ncbi:hypothetical protein CTH30272_03081 [Allocatenococcus thiocycli]|nr:hypothetical protein CTH30272_03081 [Catenococcus thiocycli]